MQTLLENVFLSGYAFIAKKNKKKTFFGSSQNAKNKQTMRWKLEKLKIPFGI